MEAFLHMRDFHPAMCLLDAQKLLMELEYTEKYLVGLADK